MFCRFNSSESNLSRLCFAVIRCLFFSKMAQPKLVYKVLKSGRLKLLSVVAFSPLVPPKNWSKKIRTLFSISSNNDLDMLMPVKDADMELDEENCLKR